MNRWFRTVRRLGPAHPIARIIALATVCGASAACASGDDGDVLVVLAAASLSDVFAHIEVDFEEQHPDIDVQVSVGGSNTLVTQVENGAPAGVVALADESLMDALVEQSLVDAPVVFATNDIAIAVPAHNPGGVTSLNDFERAELFLGACAPQVPCGRYARDAFDLAGVDPALDTESPNVGSLVTKLVAGELDAGVVYRTDIAANSSELLAIGLPNDAAVRYPIAVVSDAEDDDAAALFVDFVRSDAALDALDAAGFGAP